MRPRLPSRPALTALLAAATVIALSAGHGTALARPPAEPTPPAEPVPAADAPPPPPAVIDGGVWRSGHLQGTALDRTRGVMYFSFTNLLVMTDLSGRPLGSVTNIPGHLGDLDVDPVDGRLYGSLEYKAADAFYIAVFDPDRITRAGLDALTSGAMTTVHLGQIAEDYTADMNGDGVFDGDTGDTPDHRYGTSGIDGLSFGPVLGGGGGNRLTVTYGVYGNTARQDNDHQVLLQYDIRDWGRYERPLSTADPHRSGPAAYDGRYFVHTGNTAFGVQNLAWDPATGDWLMAVYRGKKPDFPNYTFYVIDGSAPVRVAPVRGQPVPQLGRHLTLRRGALVDPVTGISGYLAGGQYGLVPIGDGTHYVAETGTVTSDGVTLQKGRVVLRRWTGGVNPFGPVTPAATAGPGIRKAPRAVHGPRAQPVPRGGARR
ncbi:hypothetical protein ABZ714_22100 [Streptomyces sp. NPDC006798]|uniref:hypothetical protein n=1 Tax=Streptomyces sp. NPDC006798 TaxID=3155462 RepID=UPI0033ECC5C7